nr:hypothetical protein [Tanacetum cinerariifolium]
IDETAQDQGRLNEEDMFGLNDLDGDEVIVDVTTSENVEQSTKVVKKEISNANPVTTAEVARKLEAKMEEEEMIARDKDEANMAVIKQWDEVQAKTNADIELA